ncbi:MAG: hypothetical protein JO320_04370 [Alphaproteobacteria bacterium]|nr:hypothetical protein [Alphaproteobacteria bacterium]MBV9198765.1 hypothetical protein [Alphaproteobacteria bacterium]MBV9374284.1 hypothetical protein [Alphaproteobacteria bacterium]
MNKKKLFRIGTKMFAGLPLPHWRRSAPAAAPALAEAMKDQDEDVRRPAAAGLESVR